MAKQFQSSSLEETALANAEALGEVGVLQGLLETTYEEMEKVLDDGE